MGVGGHAGLPALGHGGVWARWITDAGEYGGCGHDGLYLICYMLCLNWKNTDLPYCPSHESRLPGCGVSGELLEQVSPTLAIPGGPIFCKRIPLKMGMLFVYCRTIRTRASVTSMATGPWRVTSVTVRGCRMRRGKERR